MTIPHDEEYERAARQLAAFEEMRAGVRRRALDPTAPRNVTHIKDDSWSGTERENWTVSPDGSEWRDANGALVYLRDSEGFWLAPDGHRVFDPVGNPITS
ncbi:hypothetical protein [Nocardia sp. AG03]|uniref:hypothetical protein n=1 Tax=Nocardia sp. AG03 TaxID=3025312 RepID=UPI00241884A8|nr:hypothetical protein [Nocardia sp. AG03]